MIDAFSVVSFAHERSARRRRQHDVGGPDILAQVAAAHPINVYARVCRETRQNGRVFRRARSARPTARWAFPHFLSRGRNHWPRRRGGGKYPTRKSARLGAVEFCAQRSRKFELHRHALQMRIGNLIAINTCGVHLFEPVQSDLALARRKKSCAPPAPGLPVSASRDICRARNRQAETTSDVQRPPHPL